MASTRLNKTMRETIQARVISNAYDKRESEIKERKVKLTDDVYASVYTKKLLDEMILLGAQGGLKFSKDGKIEKTGLFLTTVAKITVNFGGRRSDSLSLSDIKLIGGNHLTGYPQTFTSFDEDHVLTKTFIKLMEDEQSCIKEKVESLAQVEGILYSVNTIEKLIEVWPEVEKFTHDLSNQIVIKNLPMIQMATLNAKLGLPPDNIEASKAA